MAIGEVLCAPPTLGLALASLGCSLTQACDEFPLLSALSEAIPKTLLWDSSTLAGHTDAKATCAVPYFSPGDYSSFMEGFHMSSCERSL